MLVQIRFTRYLNKEEDVNQIGIALINTSNIVAVHPRTETEIAIELINGTTYIVKETVEDFRQRVQKQAINESYYMD